MSQRSLLAVGLVSIAAAAIVGIAGMGLSPAGFSGMSWPGLRAGQTISIDRAQAAVQSFIDRTGNTDLEIDELMEFDRNYYALIKERSSGIGAFELLVNKTTGAVGYEPGPDMMWNTKYGMMRGSGMMGGSTAATMTVTADQAAQMAQAWLDRRGGDYAPGIPDAFYGYYTFHFLKGGSIAGMLSVNGTTGQVWFHSWHGNFIQAKELAA